MFSYNNGNDTNKTNPTVHNLYFERFDNVLIAPGSPMFIITESGLFITTESDVFLITEG
jgi:hypothetical protein